MTYTLEQLEQMPISLLQGIDIRTKEEEELVQKVLNDKKLNLPVIVDLNIPSQRTDPQVMGPGGEAELQAEIDAKKAEIKNRLIPKVEAPQTPEILPGTVTGTEPVSVIPKSVTPTVKVPFCQFCDSRGVRHKKVCTRLQVNKPI